MRIITLDWTLDKFPYKPLSWFQGGCCKTGIRQDLTTNYKRQYKTLFTWSGGPRSSGVSFFCFVSPRAWTQKKPTPLDRGPPLHVNKLDSESYVSLDESHYSDCGPVNDKLISIVPRNNSKTCEVFSVNSVLLNFTQWQIADHVGFNFECLNKTLEGLNNMRA